MSTSYQTFLDSLKDKLAPRYIAQGCHDLPHVMRMEKMYPEMANLIPGLHEEQYQITVWLHNLDRCAQFEDAINQLTLPGVLRNMLLKSGRTSPFCEEIVTAVLEHSKFLDGPKDSIVMQGLRLADKWDRIGTLGGIAGFQWLGCKLPAYDTDKPFGYGSTAEGDLAKGGKGGYGTLYQGFYRILEWYPTFPLIRELVRLHPKRFKNFLFFVRSFAEEVSEAHHVPNTVEDDIRRCLGEYYEYWLP